MLPRFLTPVVAVGAVDLAKKLPWSSMYEPPASVQVSVMDIMHATGAPVFEDMFTQGQGGEDNSAIQGMGFTVDHAAPGTAPASVAETPNAGAGGALGLLSVEVGQTRSAGSGSTVPGLGSEAGSTSGVAALMRRTTSARTSQVPEIEMVEAMGQEDEGAGVFGAILHEPGGEVRKPLVTMFSCTSV